VRLIAILAKDLTHELRSLFALFMMILAPLLIAGLLFFAFGGLGRGGTSGMTATRVLVADLDRGDPSSGAFLGPLFEKYLALDDFKGILAAGSAPSEADARAAVDALRTDAAIIIPEGFSQAAMGGSALSHITLYVDPSLTLAPSLLRSITQSFLDSVAGARVAIQVASSQAAARGQTLDAAAMGRVAEQTVHGAPAAAMIVKGRAPSADAGTGGDLASIMRMVMVSMMVFFVFYTGASAAQSIVREREEGTLARLSTTPTSMGVILAGKSLAVALTIVIQVAVLLAISAALFGIGWGNPARLAVASACMLVTATGFGIFLMSFCKNSQQVGPILGVGLTLTGILGGLFTNFVPGMPAAMKTLSLAMPQGWAARMWTLALGGATAGELAVPALVLVAAGAFFFSIGVLVLRRRAG
jgi:ABC-2 type transport system permease protein